MVFHLSEKSLRKNLLLNQLLHNQRTLNGKTMFFLIWSHCDDVYTEKINAAMIGWGGNCPCSMSWMPNKLRLPCPAAERAEMRSGQRKAYLALLQNEQR